MARPRPTQVVHFTHIDHVESMVRSGMVCDTEAQDSGVLKVEVGDHSIKERRRTLVVPVGPGGVVADYVPFYFAPRSPMMFVIHNGRVPHYRGPIRDLVYVVSSISSLQRAQVPLVVSDRNAAIDLAEFSAIPSEWDDLVDWDVMNLQIWRSIPDYPDRMERRMAECLAHRHVPWRAVDEIVVSSAAHASRVTGTRTSLSSAKPVSVRPDWYF